MNIKQFQEVVEATIYIDNIGHYVIRKFKTPPGNFVLIDKIGDFIVLERAKADEICSVLWEDIAPEYKLN